MIAERGCEVGQSPGLITHSPIDAPPPPFPLLRPCPCTPSRVPEGTDRQPPADHSLSKLPPASQSGGSEIAQRVEPQSRPHCRPTTTTGPPERNKRCSLGHADRRRKTLAGLLWLGVAAAGQTPRRVLHHGPHFDGCHRDGRNMRSPITLAIPSCTWRS